MHRQVRTAGVEPAGYPHSLVGDERSFGCFDFYRLTGIGKAVLSKLPRSAPVEQRERPLPCTRSEFGGDVHSPLAVPLERYDCGPFQNPGGVREPDTPTAGVPDGQLKPSGTTCAEGGEIEFHGGPPGLLGPHVQMEKYPKMSWEGECRFATFGRNFSDSFFKGWSGRIAVGVLRATDIRTGGRYPLWRGCGSGAVSLRLFIRTASYRFRPRILYRSDSDGFDTSGWKSSTE